VDRTVAAAHDQATPSLRRPHASRCARRRALPWFRRPPRLRHDCAARARTPPISRGSECRPEAGLTIASQSAP
jgi:hypothetical protein